PRFHPVKDVTVTNQFATHVLDVVKPDRLLMPTVMSLSGPLDLPPTFDVSHFKCYRIAFEKLRVTGIALTDQFGSITIDIKTPPPLWMPAHKNGEGIADLPQYFMCYQMRITPGTPLAQPPPLLYTHDQLGPDSYPVYGPREFCVPSSVTLP